MKTSPDLFVPPPRLSFVSLWTLAALLALLAAPPGCGGGDPAGEADLGDVVVDATIEHDAAADAAPLDAAAPEDAVLPDAVGADDGGPGTARADAGADAAVLPDTGGLEAPDSALAINDANDDASTSDTVVTGDTGPGDASGPSVPDLPVAWFLHISDTHIEGATGHAVDNLAYFLQTVVPAVGPVATLHTGDLVDDGGEDDQWAGYDAITANATWPDYVELIGNHDKKHDGTDRWLSHSLAGLGGAGLYGQLFFDTPVGRVRFIRTDTSDTPWNPTNVVGAFGEDQKEAILDLPAGDPPPAITLVGGHHPLTGLTALTLLGSGERMREVLAGTGAAAYLCGHVHEAAIDQVDNTLVVQAPSLGKQGALSHTTGFVLLVLVGDRVLPRVVPMDADAEPPVAWPLVLATRPVGDGEPVPFGAPMPVSAVAFAPGGVDSVLARVDTCGWVTLTGDGAGRFSGTLPPCAQPGSAVVEIQATAGGAAHSDLLNVTVTP